jgi:hypothetical protein
MPAATVLPGPEELVTALARAGASNSAPTAMAATIHADRIRLAGRVIASLPVDLMGTSRAFR